MNMKVVFDKATVYSKFIHDSSIKLLVIMLMLILIDSQNVSIHSTCLHLHQSPAPNIDSKRHLTYRGARCGPHLFHSASIMY